MRACVIGAGTSGLVACKALRDRRIDFDCFEASDTVGGLWVLSEGRTAAYRSLHINTSRDKTGFADYPMPETYPNYPHHSLFARYLRDYAERFDLLRSIQLRCSVQRVTPREPRGYTVTLADGTSRAYDAVVVANGHHWDPRYPEPAPRGAFDGIEMHSHAYVDPTHPVELQGRRVIVVGIGNSAVDIACELAKASGPGKVTLSVRRGAWVLPKYALGRPLDQASGLPGVLPRALRRALAELWYRTCVGDVTAVGLPKPDHRLGDAHPTVSDELLKLLEQRRLNVKPQIHAREGRTVHFADGTQQLADAIVYATGYKVSFPFFERDLVDAPQNEIALYRRVFHPELEDLYFIGLCQPLGPIAPLAEAQAKLVAQAIAGEYRLPDRPQMYRVIQDERERVRARFGNSVRHTMQVDFDEYLRVLTQEAREGARRARRTNGRARR